MPFSGLNLDPEAQVFLEEEWRKLKIKSSPPRKNRGATGATGGGGLGRPLEVSPIVAVLPGLVRLILECHDRPIAKFRPVIQRLIREQQFMDLGGDAIIDPHLNVRTEQYVELTFRVLKRVRQSHRERGQRSDAPAAPQMFG